MCRPRDYRDHMAIFKNLYKYIWCTLLDRLPRTLYSLIFQSLVFMDEKYKWMTQILHPCETSGESADLCARCRLFFWSACTMSGWICVENITNYWKIHSYQMLEVIPDCSSFRLFKWDCALMHFWSLILFAILVTDHDYQSSFQNYE